MPGVPSGRGCTACRKQKKKCDITQYPCPRCKRLDIPCAGLGELRFTFKDEREKFVPGKKIVSKRELEKGLATQPSHNLSSPVTRLTAAFVEKIGPSLDIRFHLQWAFGPYLADVPRRLGASEALDAAADAVITAHVRFCAGRSSPDSALVAKHSTALSKLRHDLSDPVKAHSSEALCSVMLLMIYQSLTKSNQPSSITHADGATKILKSRGYSGPHDGFEKKLLATLRGPVVVEALMKDDIILTPQEWTELVTTGLGNVSDSGNPIICIARIPHLLRRCKDLLRCPSPPDLEITDLKRELEVIRQDCSAIISKFRDCLKAIGASPALDKPEACLHAQFLSAYAMALAAGIIINCILSALEDDCFWLSLESSHYSDEIYLSATFGLRYLPLGSFAMILFLGAAWLAALDTDRKEQIKSIYVDYERVCWGSPRYVFEKYLEQMSNRFALKSLMEYSLMQERHLFLSREAELLSNDIRFSAFDIT